MPVPVEPGQSDSTGHVVWSKAGPRLRPRHVGGESGRDRSSASMPGGGHSASWETLVLFAVNLSRLDVDINMSNVMGNTMYVRFGLLFYVIQWREREKEMFYLTTHSTHFIYGYMASGYSVEFIT